MDTLVEGDPTFAATAYREDQGCQARLLDLVVIAEGFEKGGGESRNRFLDHCAMQFGNCVYMMVRE